MSKENRSSQGMKRGPMGGHRGPGRPVEKAKNFKGTMISLIGYMRPYYINMIISMLFAVLSVVFMVVGPKILGNATTELVNGLYAKIGGTGSINFEKIGEILIFLVSIYIVSTLCNFIQNWMMAGVAQKVSYRLRKAMSEKINKLPFSYFDKQSHGEVLSRFSNDVDTVQQTLSQSLAQMISSFVQIIGYLIMMLTISWEMTLLALIVIPLSLILVTTVIKHSQKFFAKQQQSLGNVNGHIEEMYSGHIVMKAYNGEEKSIATFEEYNNDLYESAWKSQFLSGLMQPISMFVGNLGYVGVCILGGYLAMNGRITIGNIQSFITYVRSFNNPISQVAQMMNVLQSTAAAAERVFEFLAEEEDVEETKTPVEIYDENGNTDIKGQVTFENVHFGYNPDKIIIHDFSMYIKPGKKIAIVGPTGAGKTTIGKMLEQRMDKKFIDLDDVIVEKAGMTIPEIFDLFGEEGFRHLETLVAKELSAMHNMIIATGGGTIKNKENMDALRLNGIIIFIDRDINKLMTSDPNRPLLKNEDALKSLHKERYPLYQKYASMVVMNNEAIEQTIEDVIHAYQSIILEAVEI